MRPVSGAAGARQHALFAVIGSRRPPPAPTMSQKLRRPVTDFQIASEQFEMASEIMGLDQESRILLKTPFREIRVDTGSSTGASSWSQISWSTAEE